MRCERKAALLFTYVALEGPTPRPRAVSLLWPDAPDDVGRNNLVHLLRRVRHLGSPDLLRTEGDLALGPALRVDAHDVLQPHGLADIPTAALLDGMDVDDLPELNAWLLAQRERLDAVRLHALRARAEQFESVRDYDAAVTQARRMLDIDPLAEDAYRLVMRFSYLNDDRAAALRAYARCRDVLQRELGAAPSGETVRLAAQIEAGTLARTSPSRPLPLTVLRPPRVVGRSDALATMEHAWASGKMILLTGDQGVGKTRLAQDFVRAKGPSLYLPGRPGLQHVPFAAAAGNARARLAAAPHVALPSWVRRELSRVLPELTDDETRAPPISSDEDRLNFFLAHTELVRLTSRGLAGIITDDAHHYDVASAELGVFMLSQSVPLGRRDDMPRHVIIYRDGELPRASAEALEQVLEAGLAVRVHLPPLDVEATRTLLEDLDLPRQLAEPLWRSTGGNVQVLLEAARHMFESGEFRPSEDRSAHGPVLAELLERRIARLSADAVHAARAAAVLGSACTLERVAEVLNAPLLHVANAWDELVRAQVITGDAFVNDFVRDAVLANAPATTLQLLHRAAARLLSRHAVDAAVIAGHWQRGEDPGQAAPWLLQAAQAAEATYRTAEAAAYLTEAAQAFSAAGDADRCREANAALDRLRARAGPSERDR